MPQFIDNTSALVPRAIDASLRLSGQRRLDGFPSIKVVLRKDIDPSRVALISGGGSGHEPAHAGFVGRGMLTAAVCGEVFASPSVDAVHAAILAATGEAGCLLIVKNYTGDRLNFGLAAERAKRDGIDVEMVIVADDVAIHDIAQPRGIAGTLFVHKIAGALAESGESLETVASVARDVATHVRSYGVALDNCTVPGSDKDARIPDGEIEFGLGIHGEPGVETTPFESTEATVSRMLDALFETVVGGEGQILLLNNLGSTTPLEMQNIAETLLSGDRADRIDAMIGPAGLMTSLDMHGFSVSLLPAREAWVSALQAECEPQAWPGMIEAQEPELCDVPALGERADETASENAEVRRLIEDSCRALVEMQSDLNALDAKVGDGDTGSTVAEAARTIDDALDELPLNETSALLRSLGDRLAKGMGGSSGVLLAILFSAAGKSHGDGKSVPEALSVGLDRLMQYGGARPGHCTLVDALKPALDALVAGESLSVAAERARTGAEETRQMTRAQSGRSTYVPESALAGVTDPGAEAVARLFEQLAAR